MLNVALLGAGRIAQVHAQVMSNHPQTRFCAVSDAFADAAMQLAGKHDIPVRAADDILADGAIHAVLIATSTDTHSDYIERACAAGKAVFCEKPVDLSLQRAVQCGRAVEKTGQSIMVGFNRRFDPNFAALKSALDAGEIGKAELLSITSFDPAPPPIDYIKISGGLFRDMMIHDFDMAHFIMGTAPHSITAHGSCLVDPAIGAAGDIDTAAITLTYADGRICVIKNSRRAAYGYDQRLELLGADGLLSAQNILENSIVKSTTAGVTGAKPTYFFLERYMQSYAQEWDAFVTAVLEKKQMPISLQDGIIALAMAEAATQSSQSGSTVRFADVMP